MKRGLIVRRRAEAQAFHARDWYEDPAKWQELP